MKRLSLLSFSLLLVLASLMVLASLNPEHARAQETLSLPASVEETLGAAEIARQVVKQTDQLRSDIEYLASDELRGRGVGDESINQAAQFLSQRMSAIGLEVDSLGGSPLQPFDVVLGAHPADAKDNRLTVKQVKEASKPTSISLGEGFSPMAIGSASANVSGPLVFAGYGITAPKLDYDDYDQVDATGAIVMMLRKEPQNNDPKSRFQGTRNTPHALFATKIANAIKHGATGVILVNDPDSVLQAVQNAKSKIFRENQRRENISQQLATLPEEAENSRVKLHESLARIDDSLISLERELEQANRGVLGVSEAGRRTDGKPSIPVVSVARDVADQWLQQFAAKSLETIEQEIDDSGSPRSFALVDSHCSLMMELEPLKAETSNVIGVLPGKGALANQTVVVGAHYDHVGMGGEGSLAPGTIAVHNGADDNASGTAAMLASAAQVKAMLASESNHRRVVFMAFTGEERGLLGSKHYVRHPVFPLDSTVAMVNLDMVGRLRDNELTVYGTGSSETFDGLIERVNEDQEESFRLFKVPSGYGPSDHQSFYEAGVPVLFFFTGLHNDYHRPSDDFDKIDLGGLSRITDIVSDVAYELAIGNERPEYAKTDNRVQIRRQLTAFLGVGLADREDHVTISSVVAGGPAEQAGIKPGDRLVKLGDQDVRTAYEVIEWVRARSAGRPRQGVGQAGG